MNKTVKIIIAVTVIVLVVWGITASRNINTSQQTIKIGLSLPLTGNVAILGEPAKKAAELALRDVGETKYKYELVFEDDQFNPVKSATAASKLINIDKVIGIISFGSGTGNAIRSIAESSKVSQFALASDPTVAQGTYNYIHWTPAFKEGELLAKELVRRNYKSIAIIDTNHPGPLAVTDAIKKALQGTEARIVSYNLTNVGEKDFRTIINKIKAAKADIVVLEMFSPEIEIAAKQMKELGLSVPVTSVETFEWSSEPQLFEGQWFVSDSVVHDFNKKYETAYGKLPMAGSSYVYDLLSLLISLQEKSSKPLKAEEIPGLISKMGTYNSPVFGNIEIDKDGFFLTEATVKVIKNGKVELVK